jgi:hypothetical protein
MGTHGIIYSSQHGGRIPCAIGGGLIPLCRGQACVQQRAGADALHNTARAAAQRAARSSTDRRALGGLCCKLLQVAAQCSNARWLPLYGALRELRSTLATLFPHTPLFSPLIGLDAALPRPSPTPHPITQSPPIPTPPKHQPPALFPCPLRYSVIRLSSPIYSSFCPSRSHLA